MNLARWCVSGAKQSILWILIVVGPILFCNAPGSVLCIGQSHPPHKVLGTLFVFGGCEPNCRTMGNYQNDDVHRHARPESKPSCCVDIPLSFDMRIQRSSVQGDHVENAVGFSAQYVVFAIDEAIFRSQLVVGRIPRDSMTPLSKICKLLI